MFRLDKGPPLHKSGTWRQRMSPTCVMGARTSDFKNLISKELLLDEAFRKLEIDILFCVGGLLQQS